jgi:hypothetical protein
VAPQPRGRTTGKRLVGATLGYGEMKDKRQLKRMGWWTATAWCSGHMQQLVQTKVMFKADEAKKMSTEVRIQL